LDEEQLGQERIVATLRDRLTPRQRRRTLASSASSRIVGGGRRVERGGSDRAARVDRAEGGSRVYLEFPGIRDARNVVDRDTRLRVSMPVARAAELRSQLAAVVPTSSDWRANILDIIEAHRGDIDADEDAVEIVKRLSRTWHQSHG
jgi:hypothetical protein